MSDASTRAVEARMAEVLEDAKKASSSETLTQIVWLIGGLDIWHRGGHGTVGNTLDVTVRSVLSHIIRTYEMEGDDEEFCDICKAGLTSSEHLGSKHGEDDR